jgi:predicted amino acid-binding ACT domain protein
MRKAGTYAGCDLPAHLLKYAEATLTSYLASKSYLQLVRQVKQFTLRIADRPGLPAEIASALWQEGVHIRAFSAELHTGKQTIHLVVDKSAVAKKTFMKNGWEAAEQSERGVLTLAKKPGSLGLTRA